MIPTRGRHELLARALRSVRHQTTPPREILVVEDGGTTAATRRVIGQHGDRSPRVVHLAAWGGAGAARNTGLDAVRTPFVAFLDDDDWWRPTFLERCLERLAASPPRTVVVSDIEIWAPTERRAHRVSVLGAAECLYRNAGFTGQNAVFPVEPLRAVGGFDVSLRALQDRDLQLRLLRTGVAFTAVREPLVVVDQSHSHARISTSDARADGMIQFYRRWSHEAPPRTRCRMLLRVLVAQRRSSARLRRAAGQITFVVVRALELSRAAITGALRGSRRRSAVPGRPDPPAGGPAARATAADV